MEALRLVEFEWDHKKAQTNIEKHGVAFIEASTVFGDPLEITIRDQDHSVGEFRFLSMGMSSFGRILVVSYAERAANFIRIISARTASAKERRQYEEGT